jgi:aminoglycoside phosphotransferase (APT) family kinase protein
VPRVHADELAIDEPLVRALLREQFPEWADEPLARVEPDGTVNVIYRLGEEMAVRLPRRRGSEVEDDLEMRWLPALAPQLPVEIPVPVARGRPGAGYPWYWSIHTWVEGETPAGQVPYEELAAFVVALRRIDPTGAPEPAYGRGEPLPSRDEPVRAALERVDAPGALELWEEAKDAPEWAGERVWLHADIDARNVLVCDGRLTGVIDWGGMGVGDPAVDVMVAWKLVAPEERKAFREALGSDDATWLRAKGWALSQALIALGYYTEETNPTLVREARTWLSELL